MSDDLGGVAITISYQGHASLKNRHAWLAEGIDGGEFLAIPQQRAALIAAVIEAALAVKVPLDDFFNATVIALDNALAALDADPTPAPEIRARLTEETP